MEPHLVPQNTSTPLLVILQSSDTAAGASDWEGSADGKSERMRGDEKNLLKNISHTSFWAFLPLTWWI